LALKILERKITGKSHYQIILKAKNPPGGGLLVL
jgi:hypothetical protein